MDTTQLIIGAIVIVIALVVYRYRREIGLRFEGWGVKAALNAKGGTDAPKEAPAGRNVTIGRDATNNEIIMGDGSTGKKAAPTAGRNVSIGRDAKGNTIVMGDRNKIA
jgi:hypothetical protein